MTLPIHDISIEASEMAISAIETPQTLAEATSITWRTPEEWRLVARGAIKVLVNIAESPTAADLSTMGAAAYDVVNDIALMIDGPGEHPSFDLRGYRLASFDELVALPADDIHQLAIDSVIDLGLQTPQLQKTIDKVADSVLDSGEGKRHVLVGAALMRSYHIAAILSE